VSDCLPSTYLLAFVDHKFLIHIFIIIFPQCVMTPPVNMLMLVLRHVCCSVGAGDEGWCVVASILVAV
jgi:hypothetical protein